MKSEIVKIYEVYCQRQRDYEDNDNFSLFVACRRKPKIKELEKKLKDKLDGYLVCWVISAITWDLDEIEIIGLELEEDE